MLLWEGSDPFADYVPLQQHEGPPHAQHGLPFEQNCVGDAFGLQHAPLLHCNAARVAVETDDICTSSQQSKSSKLITTKKD